MAYPCRVRHGFIDGIYAGCNIAPQQRELQYYAYLTASGLVANKDVLMRIIALDRVHLLHRTIAGHPEMTNEALFVWATNANGWCNPEIFKSIHLLANFALLESRDNEVSRVAAVEAYLNREFPYTETN